MKTKSIKKTSRIQRTRDKYESNRLLILKELGMSKMDHFWFLIDCGKMFLEEHDPSDDPQFSRFYKLHNASEEFWNWFRHTWKIWESDYVKHKLDSKKSIDDYKSDFKKIAHNNQVHTSFQNTYLKTSSHGISD